MKTTDTSPGRGQRTSTPSLLLLAGALAFGACPARAATTIFSTAVLQDTGGNLDNSGSLAGAYNFTLGAQGDPTPSPTINGIAFTAINVPGNLTSYAGVGLGGTGFTLTGTGQASPNLIRDDDRTSGVASTAAIYPLIYNAVVSPGPSGGTIELNLALTGLTIGQDYRIQLVFSSDGDRSVTVRDDVLGNTSGNVSYGVTGGPKMVTGLFTADSTSQLFDLAGTPSRVQFSGFTLHAVGVPEPTSAGLLLGGGLLLLARRRRGLCPNDRDA